MCEESTTVVLIAIATGLGTLFGIFLTSFLTHARSTLELRQNWINSLRDVLSSFLTESQKFVDMADQNTRERYDQKIAVQATVYQAKLFLNKDEIVSGGLLEKMEALPSKYEGDMHATEKFEDEKAILSNMMQSILKSEWKRVRDGEVLWSFNQFIHKRLCLSESIYLSRIRLFWLASTAIAFVLMLLIWV